MSEIIPGPGDTVEYISMFDLKLRFITVLTDILQIQDTTGKDFKMTINTLFSTFVSESIDSNLITLSDNFETDFLDIQGDLTVQDLELDGNSERIVIPGSSLSTGNYYYLPEGWADVFVIPYVEGGTPRTDIEFAEPNPSTGITWGTNWRELFSISSSGAATGLLYSTGDNYRIKNTSTFPGDVIIYLRRFDL